LHFTSELGRGTTSAQIIFLTVGTPQARDGSADLSTVWTVVDDLARSIQEPKLLVIKSTVPVGTNRAVAERLARCAHAVDVASNPEFLKEGAAIDDCTKPDRVVVGV